jgi:hypothetical protein
MAATAAAMTTAASMPAMSGRSGRRAGKQSPEPDREHGREPLHG